MVTRISLILLALIIVVTVFMMAQSPSQDRDWVEYLSKITSATEDPETNLITLTNVRDWQYVDETIVDRTWLDTITIDPDNIKTVWFIVVPFGGLPIVGHTYLSFEFYDGSVYSFSIEARREIGEDYHTWTGLLNQYELAYTWSTERDAISRRVFLNQDVQRMYALDLSPSQRANLLRALTKETENLYQKPRFYNTLTSNCTSAMAEAINKNYPNSVPYSLTWNFPGHSDEFLMKENFIRVDDVEAAKTAATIEPNDPELKESAYGTPELFSKKLREILLK